LLVFVGLVVAVAGAIVGFAVGHYLASRDLAAAAAVNEQLQSQNQTLNRQIIELSTRLTAQQIELAKVRSALSALTPSKDTYNLNPNQSMIVADGHLTIGLIGPPTNQGININVNGKQQMAVAGDIIKVSPDPSTACQVSVQSFDMFAAVVIASCAAAKPPQ